MFLQLEHNQEVILRVGDPEGSVRLPVTICFNRLEVSRYSTYRVSSPLSPKDENFWKVTAKEIFKLSKLGEKERREVLEFIFQEDSGLPTLG
ncbi:hypothetical protein C343_06697 [Cryptococcus neoformans C23]|nr:hypothetical protein C347_06696 [Cryptococcus neoformans var. grubii AD2-60a]OWZ38521.1 hypothetical protein C343_06697 [Cryptococcus neoformans var. grubii C23]OXC81162.1 hypothetical protein C344_06603 [Cryptococcus neoformans var. grubii AD1-7a]OXG33116.1 hypothetical protein C359_06670 [Cryptococcus neoformans var. grubii Bt120]OXG35034.1 hypothetical protein C360_03048 [Cryptococcus neoformans var. grubii Bt15]OXG56555.1 hypothetical protein C351_06757 [Cryptococcus neoformans var. gru